MMGGPIFEVSSLGRTFGKGERQVRALTDVSLDIRAGERLGVVGGSGSGKTTLVRLLAALDRPTSGTVLFDGQEISAAKEGDLGRLRSRVQLVFQDPNSSLNPRMRVADIVAEPLRSPRLRNFLGKIDERARVGEVLEAVGLDAESSRRYPHEFSGGQRQRVAIARALAPRPEVLIADEPVSALDVLVREQIIALLAELVHSQRLTLVMVSHDLGVIRRLCDSVVVLRAGEIVERGPVAQVLSHPSTDYTKALLAAVPRLRLLPSELFDFD
jgi:peptide/nickel transport system ATP-binding protein